MFIQQVGKLASLSRKLVEDLGAKMKDAPPSDIALGVVGGAASLRPPSPNGGQQHYPRLMEEERPRLLLRLQRGFLPPKRLVPLTCSYGATLPLKKDRRTVEKGTEEQKSAN